MPARELPRLSREIDDMYDAIGPKKHGGRFFDDLEDVSDDHVTVSGHDETVPRSWSTGVFIRGSEYSASARGDRDHLFLFANEADAVDAVEQIKELYGYDHY